MVGLGGMADRDCGGRSWPGWHGLEPSLGEAPSTSFARFGSTPDTRSSPRSVGLRLERSKSRLTTTGRGSIPRTPSVGPLHLAVQTRDVRWTNHIDRTTLGPEVPGVITTCNLAPAGTHRGRSVVDTLISAKAGGQQIEEVVWDPGYSIHKPGSTSVPLAQVGIVQTFQPVTHQRGRRPFSGDALLIDGQLFSSHLPEELRDLPAPPRGAPEAEKVVYEAKFNQRARWRLVRHVGPDADGVTRWRCPFCAGLLRSRQVPKTMRTSRNSPLVHLREGSSSCCSGILSVAPVELPLAQRVPYWTTAWRISMGRRQVVESVNAALKGSFVDLTRGFFPSFRAGENIGPAWLHPCRVQP